MANTINEYELDKDCRERAAEIFARVLADNPDDMPEDLNSEFGDAAHEEADSHAWVIYTHSAIQLCANCDISAGEEFLEDVGLPETITFGGLASIIALGEIRARIMSEIENLTTDFAPDYSEFLDIYADSSRGQYIPQFFAESVSRDKLANVDLADLDILASGPDSNESYWDIWTDILDNAELKDDSGNVWTLHQDGDLFMVRKDIPGRYWAMV